MYRFSVVYVVCVVCVVYVVGAVCAVHVVMELLWTHACI